MGNDMRMHCLRTALYSAILASACGFCNEEIQKIYTAAMVHDIGKTTIPDDILKKPGKLTPEEFAIMKQHAKKGAEMMKGCLQPEVVDMIRYHHESMNGTGYYGLTEDDIPKGARIIHICDVYDALITERSYKTAWNMDAALSFLKENAGVMFDRTYVDVFCRIIQQTMRSENSN